jgi:diguanylate cyclase (GGDEF)-like protein
MPTSTGIDASASAHDAVFNGGDSLRLVRIRLALTLIAVAILPLAAVAPIARAVLDGTRTALAERLSAEADHAAAEVRRELGGIRLTLEELAASDVAEAAVSLPAGDPGAGPMANRLQALLERTSGVVTAAALADPDGGVRVRVGPESAILSGTPPPPTRPATFTVLPDESGRLATLEIAVAIPADAAAPPLGSVVASIPISTLLAWSSPEAVAAGRSVELVDAGGRILASIGPGVGLNLPGTVIDFAANGSEASEGQSPIELPGLGGWRVVATAPLPVTDIPLPAVATLVGLIGLLFGFTWWMARQILRPAAVLETERARFHELYQTAREASLRDSLTGLGNHRAFQEAVSRAVDQARRYGTPFSLILIDIDEFKRVNDSRGHATGDELLAEVGNLIRATVRQADAGYRVGGDEFAILLPSTDPAGAEATARRLLNRGLEDRSTGRYRGPISFSAGITACPEFGKTRLEVTAQADAALYRGKRSGRTLVTVFDPALDRGHIDDDMRAELSAAVSVVIESGALSPVYQPIVHLPTGRILGYEGLVRVRPDTGFAHTGALFDAAEVAGRVLDLDRAALDVVLGGAGAVPEPALLSLNVSPRSFEAPEFNATVFLAILRRHGVAPERVLMELTERDAIREPERLRATILQLQEAGVRVAADDVGAGNAGLRLLSQFRFDVVKIDLSLVQGGASQDQTLSVLTSLVGLARRWGALTIAEGVETPAQLEMIRALDIDAGQGYLLGRPGAVLDLDRLDLEAMIHGAKADAPPSSGGDGQDRADLGANPFAPAPAAPPAAVPTAASVIAGGAPSSFARR